MSGHPVIEVSNLSVRFGEQSVLENVSFSLERGEFMGLIGPNGGGKTVLLKTLLGLLKPSSGSVTILSTSPQAARSRVGYVPQFAHFDRNFPIRVIDVVLMGRLGLPGSRMYYSRADRARALEALEQVELADKKNAQIGRLSGGQAQRVLIARALASDPELLLLDEPTASLDTRIGRNLYELLKGLSANRTIVLVSHDISVIAGYVQSIGCLNRGLHFHQTKEITPAMMEELYGCPLELLAHGLAHRVLDSHERKS